MSLSERLQLDCLVNYGLPVNFAAKLIGIKQTNTDRIIKELQRQRDA